MVVQVIPGNTAAAQGAKESEAIVKDNNDGTYTATYSVECRGDYKVESLDLPDTSLRVPPPLILGVFYSCSYFTLRSFGTGLAYGPYHIYLLPFASYSNRLCLQ